MLREYLQSLEDNHDVEERGHDAQSEGLEQCECRQQYQVERMVMPLPEEQPEVDQGAE